MSGRDPLSDLPERVSIVEVGPRDGLQNEPAPVSVQARLELIARLVAAGCRRIEAGAFVSPKWVPQMAGSAEVFARLPQTPGVAFSALVPNLHGLEAALRSGVREIAVFAAASETFSRRNINCSIAESLARFRAVCEAARAAGVAIRGYVSCIAGCPYEGTVPIRRVVEVARALHAMGCYEVSLGDTIGVGTPRRIVEVVHACASELPLSALALHLHDTYGQALANALAGLECGVRTLDASVAGLGGCPYAPGAAGNLASEDLVYMLEGLAIPTGIDLERLIAAGAFICDLLGRPNRSRVALARACRRSD